MDPTRAVAAAAHAFALGAPHGPPVFVARGAMGEVWQLETDEGRWAVKVLFERAWRSDGVPRDVRFQEAAAAAGVRIPQPRHDPTGRAVVDGFRVYEWVDLAPGLARPVDRATAVEAAGLLGRIHALAFPVDTGEAVDDWYVRTPPPEEWAALADRAEAAQAPWARALRARLPRIDELGRFVDDGAADHDGDIIVCHRDFDPTNFFRPVDGGPLVVLDWENAGPLSAASELAMARAAWVHPDDVRPFLDAYRDGGGPAEITGPGHYATLVATTVNYLRVVVLQSLDDDGHRHFAEPIVEDMLRDGGAIDTSPPRPGWSW